MTSTTGVLTITAVADIPQSISIALACEIQVSAYILMCQAQIRVVFDIEAITVLVTQMGGKFGTTLHPSAVFNYIHGRSYVDNSFQRGQIYCYLCWLVSLKGGSERSYGKKKSRNFSLSKRQLARASVKNCRRRFFRRAVQKTAQPLYCIRSIVMKWRWYNPTKDAYLPIQHHQEETRQDQLF